MYLTASITVHAAFHDEAVRDVKASLIQCDEIWSFTYAKQKNVEAAKAAPDGAGDTWTWTARDSDSKLIVSWLVGGSDSEYAIAFMDDLGGGLANRDHGRPSRLSGSGTLKTSPAMAAGLSDRLWEMGDIVALIDAAAPKPGQRGPCKKSATKIQTETPPRRGLH